METNTKVAIVTGGGSGLGKETALKLAENGASITIVDVSEKSGKETVELIKAKGGESIFVKADVSKAEEVKTYVEKTVAEFGRIDMFFNNAGISGPGLKLADHTIEQFDQIIDINLKGAIYGMKYVIPEMLKTGGGSIVNTASTAGVVGVSNVSPYAATKHGIVGLTKTAAIEYGKENIQVNAIAPGTTETPMVKEFGEQNPETMKATVDSIPAGRLGKPEEVANLVSFLLGGQAPYITGVVVPIDGGVTAQ
ncbi:SDR family NAD(P)-dependent oxidoreductase [Oceanobacillus manasiensis]|uniref:SDR family NAD(P)-dependent oxidoreductase n=1 Tax=Oceanobacillus manasiensis TaxID=586413 RepID=UPI0005A6C88B|nr:glucose 1-dehydrogenase [Oceanobacillus manasiensis]